MQKMAYVMRISDWSSEVFSSDLAARVALSAEVARAYLQLRGTQAQLDITRQNLDVADRTLRLAESRERNGVATRVETASARAQLATDRNSVVTDKCGYDRVKLGGRSIFKL